MQTQVWELRQLKQKRKNKKRGWLNVEKTMRTDIVEKKKNERVRTEVGQTQN